MTQFMRKHLNLLFSFLHAAAVICVMSVLSTISLSAQASVSRTTPKVVQRSAELSTDDSLLPTNPVPQPKPASFFTFRSSWKSPALKPNKKSWAIFAAAHVALGITLAYDIHHTHGARETVDSEVPAVLAVSALDFAAFKFFSPALSIEAPIYGIQHYARDAAK